MTEQKHRDKGPQAKAIRVFIALSVVVFLITLIAGIMSDSVALLLSASVEFIIVFMAFLVNSSMHKLERPPDQYFHFGYDKFEPLTVVIQGLMIMFSCVFALYFAAQDMVHAEDIKCYNIPIHASIISGLIAIFTALYINRAAARARSHMLKTSALHCLVDSMLSFGMAAGFAAGLWMKNMGYRHLTPYVDPIMTFFLAAALVWTPVKHVRAGLRQLLDAAPAKDVREAIEVIIEKHKARAFGIRSIRMRKAGDRVFLYVCFEMHGHTTMNQAQEFVRSFEDDISRTFPKYDCIVYFYPAK